MTDPNATSLFRGVRSIVPPSVLAIVAVLILIESGNYGSTARQLPMLVAGILFALAILDLISRLPGRIGSLLHAALGAGFEDREMKSAPVPAAEVVHAAWIVATVASLVLFGFLVTIPAFVFCYSKIHGDWPAWLSAVTAALTLCVVALVFEVLLDYSLYRGVLFGAEFYV